MTAFMPPTDDIKFVLDSIADIKMLSSLDGFEHIDTDTVHTVIDEAARFMADVVAPTNRVGDLVGAVHEADGSVTMPPEFHKAWRQYVDAGWNAVKCNPEYGGHGFPTAVGTAVQEMLTSANMAFSLCPMLTASAILAIDAHGTDEQKGTFLANLISGHWTGTMVLTESGAGSDVGALRAKATPNADGTWSITGTKIFITWGDHDMAENIIHLVLARVPDSPPGTKGISLFIVPKFLVNKDGSIGDSNNVTAVSVEHKLGIHGSPTCVMSYENSIGYLIGEENQGMRYMFTMMNDARLHVGIEGLGVAERSYQQALAYAQERRQGRAIDAPSGESSPIIDHPDVRHMLLQMKTRIEAMRGLMYANAAALDVAKHHRDETTRNTAAERASLLTPLSKGWGTDQGVFIASLGIQIHGGAGFIEEAGAAQHYRDVRIAPIYEGTNGIQAIDLVMRKLSTGGGDVIASYVAEMQATADAAAELLPAASMFLTQALTAVKTSVNWLVEQRDRNDALAGATTFLELLGSTAGGYYLVRLAIAASGAGREDAELRVQRADFYAKDVLARAAGLVPSITAGVATLDGLGV
ncbi:MAG: acyl-CoA dehydrogenase [Acidobacteria bacterium]|nr:acyl-CoA dehydrogenase [Acidobacteriota bacterium]